MHVSQPPLFTIELWKKKIRGKWALITVMCLWDGRTKVLEVLYI